MATSVSDVSRADRLRMAAGQGQVGLVGELLRAVPVEPDKVSALGEVSFPSKRNNDEVNELSTGADLQFNVQGVSSASYLPGLDVATPLHCARCCVVTPQICRLPPRRPAATILLRLIGSRNVRWAGLTDSGASDSLCHLAARHGSSAGCPAALMLRVAHSSNGVNNAGHSAHSITGRPTAPVTVTATRALHQRRLHGLLFEQSSCLCALKRANGSESTGPQTSQPELCSTPFRPNKLNTFRDTALHTGARLRPPGCGRGSSSSAGPVTRVNISQAERRLRACTGPALFAVGKHPQLLDSSADLQLRNRQQNETAIDVASRKGFDDAGHAVMHMSLGQRPSPSGPSPDIRRFCQKVRTSHKRQCVFSTPLCANQHCASVQAFANKFPKFNSTSDHMCLHQRWHSFGPLASHPAELLDLQTAHGYESGTAPKRPTANSVAFNRQSAAVPAPASPSVSTVHHTQLPLLRAAARLLMYRTRSDESLSMSGYKSALPGGGRAVGRRGRLSLHDADVRADFATSPGLACGRTRRHTVPVDQARLAAESRWGRQLHQQRQPDSQRRAPLLPQRLACFNSRLFRQRWGRQFRFFSTIQMPTRVQKWSMETED
uniref:ANK_REP_REGION domain-containing protein n=1 Tax=Macrostomum lignano TaxID=282301 RepID=A0A1I8JNZ8_9PLAT